MSQSSCPGVGAVVNCLGQVVAGVGAVVNCVSVKLLLRWGL